MTSPEADSGPDPAGVPATPADSHVAQVPSAELVQLAQCYGVATEFWDWQGRQTTVPARTITEVLRALEVPAATPREVERSLADARLAPWRRTLPPVLVTREGRPHRFAVHLPQGEDAEVWVELEGGGERRGAAQLDAWVEPQEVDGQLLGEATYAVPAGLPLGWHTVCARTSRGTASAPLVVTPATLGLPEQLRAPAWWGFMTQLYSVRSQRSWGLGDIADLAELAAWSARELGADFVLVNPLHAAEPVVPMEPSPYLPTTRRFVNPVYIRVEDIREVAYLPAPERSMLEELAQDMRARNTDPGELDRNAVWQAKRDALQTVFRFPRSPARQAAFEAFCEREGEGLRSFATWCALAEHFGLPSSTWPAEAHDPATATVRDLRQRLADRVEFFMWLQWVVDEQLADAQRTAVQAGMGSGIVHDLAVGVHPEGADTWALQGVLAQHVSVGAPPDAFNQQGQDWSQPPWRPDRLQETGYAPYRDMLRTVLRHAGGLRVDHVIGLFRLWWVPNGAGPAEGTYVRYDHEALVGILALEAHRAGAFVVGEDLGTVEPWVRDYLRERGVLGTSILWFEKDDQGRPLPPERWRELCLATVTTHDLPPTAGYLAGEHIDLRERLGLLTRPVETEREVDAADRAAVLALLRSRGLLADGGAGEDGGAGDGKDAERDQVEALHRLLSLTPSRLLGVALSDAVGDRRAMNQPGTSDEYPNWRLPLADGSGSPVLLEELMASARVRSLAQAVTARD